MRNMRIFFYCLWAQFVCFAALAQDGGRVLLDLRDDAPNEVFDEEKIVKEDKLDDLSAVFKVGYDFVQDVKEYNELLPEDAIDKDFTEDMMQKYPKYNEKFANKWQNYVRHGVKAYRFYNHVKQKVKDWVLNYELPIVVPDDQYEMGEDEEYIESKDPVVRYNFKKVIAYSNQEKDKLAVAEKLAKDNNQPRPSQVIKWYRENIAQGNWKKLAKSIFYENILEQDQEDKPKVKSDDLHYMVFLRNNGWDEQGNFDGVLRFVIPDGKVVPLSYYGDYKGLSIDFDDSENIDYVHTYLTKPYDTVIKGERQILFYAQSSDVYFKAKVKEADKNAVLRVKGIAPLCQDEMCKKVNYALDLQIKPVEKLKESSRGYYVQMISSNVPKDENANKFDIHKVEWQNSEDNTKYLNVEFSVKDLTRAKIFLIGEEARKFSAPHIDLQKNMVSAKFKLLDDAADAPKEVKLWLSQGYNKQYIAVKKIEEESIWDVSEDKFNLGLALLAFIGGLCLNLFSGGAPVLWLKLRNLSDFGGKNYHKIRNNWGLCSLGIVGIFIIAAVVGGCLKYYNVNFVWGMQFLQVEFLLSLLWLGFYWWMIVWGYGLQILSINNDKFMILKQVGYGIWAAVWGIVLGGVYWCEFMPLAWQMSPMAVVVVLISAGIGMALPYGIVAIFPKITDYIAIDMKWRELILRAVTIAIFLLLVWMILLIYPFIDLKSTWLLVACLLGAGMFLVLRKVIVSACDRMIEIKDKREQVIKFVNRIVFLAVIIIICGSFILVQRVASYKQQLQEDEILEIKFDSFSKSAQEGQKILLKIEADWCLLCRYNNWTVFMQRPMQDELENKNVRVISIDAIKYNEQLKDFLKKFNFRGLPLYILFSPHFVDGIVLPQRITSDEITELIRK